MRPAKTQISLGIRCPLEKTFGPELPTERTVKTLIRLMPSLIRVFAGRTYDFNFVGFVVLRLILSYCGSFITDRSQEVPLLWYIIIVITVYDFLFVVHFSCSFALFKIAWWPAAWKELYSWLSTCVVLDAVLGVCAPSFLMSWAGCDPEYCLFIYFPNPGNHLKILKRIV